MFRACLAFCMVAAAVYAAPLKDELPAGAFARLGSPSAPAKETKLPGEVNTLVFLDDKTLFVGTNGGWNSWDLEKRERRQEKPVVGPAFIAVRDSQRLFIGSSRKLHVIEPITSATMEPAKSLDAASDVNVVAISPGGNRIVFTDGESKLSVLDGSTGKIVANLEFPSRPVAAALTANGRVLAVVSREGAARVYNLDVAGKLDHLFTKRVARSDHIAAAFSPDGRLFAVSSAGRILIVDSAAGRPMLTLERRFGEGDVRCLAYSPDGRQIAVGRNGPEAAVRVSDVISGVERAAYEGHLGDIHAVAFSPDGKALASAGSDTSVLLWRVPASGPGTKSVPLADAWNQLDSLDAPVAYRCMEQMLTDGPKTVELLRERFKKLPAEHAEIQRWIKELDHDEFRTREAARKGLTNAGLRAAAALLDPKRKALGAEGEQRIGAILESFETKGLRIPESGLFGDPLRMVRAARVLETIGSKDARQVLEEAAKGTADHRLTAEAKAALATWIEKK